MQRNLIIAAIGLFLLLPLTNEPAKSNLTAIKQHASRTTVSRSAEAKAMASVSKADVKKAKPAETPKPVAPTPPPKVYWAVAASPKVGVSVEQINTALATYQDLGLTKHGAAYLVGNFVGESGLQPCGIPGDGGLALGLGQWHPNRRPDMPCGFSDQLVWAFNIEMARDRPQLRAALLDPNASIATIMVELHNWERWGQLGGRWVYAQAIFSQI